MANFGGATKRAFGAAIVTGSFSIGNIIGPQTFQARDAYTVWMRCSDNCAVLLLPLAEQSTGQNQRRSEGRRKRIHVSRRLGDFDRQGESALPVLLLKLEHTMLERS
jgi:hypothetical protein